MFTHYLDILTSIRFQMIFTLLLLTATSVAGARQLDPQTDAWTSTRTLESSTSGLIYSLPQINQQALQSEINRLSQQLTQRQEDLNQFLEENRFSAADAVIVAAVPGGLLYAAFKKQKSVSAEKELSGVLAQLVVLNDHLALTRQSRKEQLIASR